MLALTTKKVQTHVGKVKVADVKAVKVERGIYENTSISKENVCGLLAASVEKR